MSKSLETDRHLFVSRDFILNIIRLFKRCVEKENTGSFPGILFLILFRLYKRSRRRIRADSLSPNEWFLWRM